MLAAPAITIDRLVRDGTSKDDLRSYLESDGWSRSGHFMVAPAGTRHQLRTALQVQRERELELVLPRIADASPEELALLSIDPERRVQAAVAAAPGCPQEILLRLARDGFFDEVSGNPGLTDPTATELVSFARGALISGYAEHGDADYGVGRCERGLEKLATNMSLSYEFRRGLVEQELASDRETHVAVVRAVGESPATERDLLELLIDAEFDDADFGLVRNPVLPRDLLVRLAERIPFGCAFHLARRSDCPPELATQIEQGIIFAGSEGTVRLASSMSLSWLEDEPAVFAVEAPDGALWLYRRREAAREEWPTAVCVPVYLELETDHGYAWGRKKRDCRPAAVRARELRAACLDLLERWPEYKAAHLERLDPVGSIRSLAERQQAERKQAVLQAYAEGASPAEIAEALGISITELGDLAD